MLPTSNTAPAMHSIPNKPASFSSLKLVDDDTRLEDDTALRVEGGDVATILTGQKGSVSFFSAEGTAEALDLILSFIDKEGFEIAPVETKGFKRDPWISREDGDVLGCRWTGDILIPSGARSDLIVLRMSQAGNDQAEYVNKIVIVSDTGKYKATMAPNTWIHRNNGARVFFHCKLAYITKKTPPSLVGWRKGDLRDIQGTMQQRAFARQDWDRIYNYDVYNDLAAPEEDRPILGGSKAFPYPRRIRTGRVRVPRKSNPNIMYESRTGSFFVPLNEKFNTTKQVNFSTYAALSVLPVVGNTIHEKFFGDPRDPINKFDSFSKVDQVYAKLEKKETTLPESKVQAIAATKPQTWLRFPQLFAVLNPLKAITSMVGGVVNLLKFPAPLVMKDRLGIWQLDEEWGRQALAGVNPCVIAAVTPTTDLGTITEEHLEASFEPGHTLAELLAQADSDPRLLVIDHTPVFADYAELISDLKPDAKGQTRVGYSGKAVLYRRDDDQWVPVAIELTEGGGDPVVYTPADTGLWMLAKGVFNSLDSGFHQLVTHWLRTHACTEPYIIAMRRRLSELHPVFKLLAPHTAFTLQINANARSNLIAANGIIERIFTPGPYAIEMSSKAYGALWRFDREGLPADLISRGLAKRGEDGSLNLLLKDYPYADDGMLLWNAIEKWVGEYLRMYYSDDGEEDMKVANDDELMAWWWEIQNEGHADIKEGWPKLETIDDLTQILTTMIWIVSGHHAAINFSQYPFTAYSPNRPTMVSKPIPKKTSKLAADMAKDPKVRERVYIESLVGFDNTLTNALTVELLSSHADNEVYIGEENHMFITDDAPLKAYRKFTDEIKAIEETIEARNKDPSRKMRNGNGALPYTTLLPTSDKGVTNRGVPQSISI